MLIIHASYFKNNFYLWGEVSFDTKNLHPANIDETIPQPHPWSADENTLNEALKQAGIKHPRRGSHEKTATAYVSLPSRSGIPIPSSPLLGELTDLDEKDQEDQFSLLAERVM